MKKLTLFLMFASIAVMWSAQAAMAGIVSVTGVVNDSLGIPSDLQLGVFESSTEIFVFEEQQNVVLSVGLDVDITEAGTYLPVLGGTREDDLSPGVIAALTTVNSYIVHFDEATGQSTTLSGSITLDRACLGLIILTDYLDLSDGIVGNPDTTYDPFGATYHEFRGVDLLTHDQDPLELSFAVDGCTVSFTLTTANAMDEFRIIEAPEPATLGLLVLGGLTLLRRRRK